MSDKPKFFFEEDVAAEDAGLNQSEQADFFFGTLKKEGVIKDYEMGALDEARVEALAEMKVKTSTLLSIEYGVYQDNYAIHFTPINANRNIKTEADERKALVEIVTIMAKHVPDTLHVDIFRPRADWKMKVISTVIREGATAWNLNKQHLEDKMIPELFAAVEKVILECQ